MNNRFPSRTSNSAPRKYCRNGDKKQKHQHRKPTSRYAIFLCLHTGATWHHHNQQKDTIVLSSNERICTMQSQGKQYKNNILPNAPHAHSIIIRVHWLRNQSCHSSILRRASRRYALTVMHTAIYYGTQQFNKSLSTSSAMATLVVRIIVIVHRFVRVRCINASHHETQ